MEHGSARVGEIFDFGMLHLEWPTALFILVIFLLTMFVLNALLFQPILKTLESRQKDLDQNKKETEDLARSIEKSDQDYQAKLAEMREEIQSSRQNAIDEALANAKQIVEQAKENINQKLADAEKELDQERQSALDQAASLTSDLTQLIKSKVLA